MAAPRLQEDVTLARRFTHSELASMFSAGAERKMTERERFLFMVSEDPGRSAMYMDLADYLATDIRFYRMAAAYYSGDTGSLDTGDEEDLLLMAGAKDIPPRIYAQYLREIGPDAEDEKVTHQALGQLKTAIASTFEAMVSKRRHRCPRGR